MDNFVWREGPAEVLGLIFSFLNVSNLMALIQYHPSDQFIYFLRVSKVFQVQRCAVVCTRWRTLAWYWQTDLDLSPARDNVNDKVVQWISERCRHLVVRAVRGIVVRIEQ